MLVSYRASSTVLTCKQACWILPYPNCIAVSLAFSRDFKICDIKYNFHFICTMETLPSIVYLEPKDLQVRDINSQTQVVHKSINFKKAIQFDPERGGSAPAPPLRHVPGGCFTNSDGPSDRATDHRPMLFVHNRMVRPESDSPSLLVKQPPGAKLFYTSGIIFTWPDDLTCWQEPRRWG